MRLIDVEAPCKIEIELDGKKCHATVTAPTIDAVPVVRCKDCVWCEAHGYCDKNEMFVENREWFCADGERKDDEVD